MHTQDDMSRKPLCFLTYQKYHISSFCDMNVKHQALNRSCTDHSLLCCCHENNTRQLHATHDYHTSLIAAWVAGLALELIVPEILYSCHTSHRQHYPLCLSIHAIPPHRGPASAKAIDISRVNKPARSLAYHATTQIRQLHPASTRRTEKYQPSCP